MPDAQDSESKTASRTRTSSDDDGFGVQAEQTLAYLRSHEADPTLVPPNPHRNEPESAELRKWIEPRFSTVSHNTNLSDLSHWCTSLVPPSPRFHQELLARLQATCGLAEGIDESRGVSAYTWLRLEAVGVACARAALAQRTFLFLLDWRAAQQALPELQRQPVGQRLHPDLQDILNDANEAAPLANTLKAASADPAKSTSTLADRSDRLCERIDAVTLYAGAIACLHPYMVPTQDATIPASMPVRRVKDCLGSGTTWLLSLLHRNAVSAADRSYSLWEQNCLAQPMRIMTNGSDDESLFPGAKTLARDLALQLVLDADGVTACQVQHPQAVSQAASHPDPTLAASFVESVLLRILDACCDAVYSSPRTRHSYGDPSDVPKPEASLFEKCDHIYRYWLARRDPQTS